MLTLQQIINRLSDFWAEKGCVLHQGYDLEVGAGTFNPATFLRCLGPEPYKTAYVEPTRRPQDGRYGENPNRVQCFHQYQVIMKPSPPDIQQACLKSIEALGYRLSEHDIRFVGSDWEGPTLGAWGLGWEMWIDGMEVLQFTYFQAVGSLPLNPIAVELTYGLERLAMYIQNVDNIFDVKWNDELTMRDIAHRSEVEWSTYNFTEATTAMWLRHFDDFEKEAKSLIALHLPIPAYDFVLKASHAFNILDARGVISVTERTGYIARIRDLARLIAMEYLTQREKLGFPLLRPQRESIPQKPVPFPAVSFDPAKKRDFLFEIGSEELPETFVPIGCQNLKKALENLLSAHELSYERIEVYGTPRRLAALVSGLTEGTTTKTVEKRGPAIASAFDADGKPTPQGAGFFKSLGHDPAPLASVQANKVKGLEVRTLKEVPYLFANVTTTGQSTFRLLAEHLPSLILNLDFPKKMRWGSLDISYARPLQWIAALFGDEVVPFQVGDITTDRLSRGHAQRDPTSFPIPSPSKYLETLKQHHVLASIEERKQSILEQLKTLEGQMKGQALEQKRVLAQVLHLVEWPQLTYASFDAHFLKAPSEVLISEMVEHQKYFPVADDKGQLKNLFVITADNTPSDAIRQGNQKVLSARLSDGVFLYEQDLKVPLESFNEKLKVMTFQKELGSMLDKVMRLTAHVQVLNEHLSLANQKKLLRAALLSKADLCSALVGEFPDLQGTAGKTYALAQKEDPEVASALEEQWMPKGENTPLPHTPTGIILSLADKIDNLLGYYSAGLKPTSSSDPYALRRQTLGLLKILITGKHTLNLKKLFEACSTAFAKKISPDIIDEILQFITNRAKSLFEEEGFKKDEIEASLQGLCIDPYDQFCKVRALHQFRTSNDAFAHLYEVYKRAKGQLTKPSDTAFNPSLAHEPAERALLTALNTLEKHWKDTLLDRDYVKAFQLLATLQPPLAQLFDTVKILDDNPDLRANRIALLQKVFTLFQDLLDFSKIQ
jgi:glycyl-tRNA synthetase